MTETQRRIRAYKRALPHMKERVIAVALLLAMSVSMMSSATFAWLTLSTNPEVSSLATTIVANGNLEIALSDKDGMAPDESAVGDGGQNVALSNLTWGNLVNLADASYGLDHLVLRPATRNDKDLLNSPVNAVIYGADGRVVDYTTDFAYSNYDASTSKYLVPTKEITKEDGTKEQVNTTHYGVRAVSSVKYENVKGNAFLVAAIDQLDKDFTDAQKKFQSIYLSDAYMKTVGYLVGVHVSYVLGDEDQLVDQTEVVRTKEIAQVFYDSMYKAGEVIVKMINLHQYLSLTDETQGSYKEHTFSDVFMVGYDGTSTFTSSHLNNTLLNQYKSWIPAIETYRTAWVKTVNFYNGVNKASQKSQVYWSADLMSSVNLLCDMNTATLDGLTANEMAADMVNQAASILMSDASDHVAVIHNGALKDADQLLDGNMKVESGKISITVVVPEDIKQKVKDKVGVLAYLVPDVLTLKPEVDTAAEPPALLITDYQTASKRASGGSSLKGQAIAADTYAMAIDFWVRTNVKDSLLILEGELQTEEEVLTDAEGNPVLDDNGNPVKRTVVTGYGGVNRVWDELDDPTTDAGSLIYKSGGISMTQGSGSCYIFYADDPEQQAQSLNMLRAMRVAFIDDKGRLLNVAEMDVANAVEDGGRVIVPLRLGKLDEIELEDGSILSDDEGEPITRYIQTMPQNKPQRITALIYLDGELLSNSEVMEAGTIKGQLNIQFGTTDMTMEPQKDADLMESYYTIDFTNKLYEFASYDPDKCIIELKMQLMGTQPTTVKGNFLSIINEHQGARQEEFTMQLGEDGFWTATIPFAGPGNYELRSLKLDGVDVALTPDDPETTTVEGNVVKVKISGVAINSLNCVGWETGKKSFSWKTANTYYQQTINLNIASDSYHSVRGVFIGDNGQNVSVNFDYLDAGQYRGTALFSSSGTYKMTYLEIDGKVVPLSETMYKTITLQLGLKAYVTVGTPVLSSGEVNEEVLKNVKYDPATGWSFVYTCEEPLDMPVNVVIIDDQDNKLTGLTGLVLTYGAPGSETNLIDTNLTWDYTTGSYVGEFVDFQYSGVYQYRYVYLGDGINYIGTAASAPSITSIPPDVMEYVEQAAYEPLTYEWGADRNLYVTLKNAAAAQLFAELTRYNADGTVAQTVSAGPITANSTDADKVSTFVIQVPSDGDWKLTGLEAAIVFAKDETNTDGKFFSGAPIYGEDKTTVVGYDRVDLTDAVLADQIGSYFLTDIDITVDKEPTSFTSDFMVGKEYNNMTIAVNNQGRPLAEVLEEVKTKFSTDEDPIDSEVVVGMTYKLFTDNLKYTDFSNTALPTYNFGSNELTLNKDTGKYHVGDMNFLLKGQYDAAFTLTISGEKYTGTDIPEVLSTAVRVGWNDPTLEVTGVTPGVDEELEVNVGSGTSPNYISGVSNYYESNYANVYFGVSDKTLGFPTEYTVPQVEMTISDVGKAASATATAKNKDHSVLYNFNSAGDWKASKEIGSLDDLTRTHMGQLFVDTVKLTYGGIDYEFDADIEIKQDVAPIYLQYSLDFDTNELDSSKLTTPNMAISPDGRPFRVTLPGPTNNIPDETEKEVLEAVTTSSNVQVYTTNKYYSVQYQRDIETRVEQTNYNTYNATYSIENKTWKIAGETYSAGREIVVGGTNGIPSGSVATAIVVRDAKLIESNPDTVTQYRYKDTATGRTKKGTQIGDLDVKISWTGWSTTKPVGMP